MAMILYLVNPDEFIKWLLELISEFSKLQCITSTLKISCASIHQKFKNPKKIKKTIAFLIPYKRTKYLGINLMKKVKHLYADINIAEKLKTTSKMERYPVVMVGGLTLIKMIIVPKQSTDSM